MNRLSRYEDHRFVGVRSDMWVYDCDDPSQFDLLKDRLEREGLAQQNLIQTFGPDSLEEAHNRGFRRAGR